MTRHFPAASSGLFLDSGAFTAASKGKPIDLRAYCRFVREWMPYLEVYANLDDLASPEKSWTNQKNMEAEGLQPLPCFHFGEPFSWLTKYADNYHRLAIGGLVGKSAEELVPWLDEVWRHLTDVRGQPTNWVHAFGITALDLIERYPWHSVDSTNWIHRGSKGDVVLYFPATGERLNVNVSEKSGTQDKRNAHYLSMVPAYQKRIREHIESLGYSMEALATDYKQRHKLSAESMHAHAMDTSPPLKWYAPVDLFHEVDVRRSAAPRWESLSLYLAGAEAFPELARGFNLKGMRCLMSYFYIQNKPEVIRKVYDANQAE